MHKQWWQGEGVGFVWEKFLVPEGLLVSVHYMFLLNCQCSLALLLRTAAWEGLVTLKRRFAGTFDVALCNVNGSSLNPPKASSFMLGGHSCVLPCSVWSVESGSTFASALKPSLNLKILLTLQRTIHYPPHTPWEQRVRVDCVCVLTVQRFSNITGVMFTTGVTCNYAGKWCGWWCCLWCVCALKLSLYCPPCLCDRVSSCWMVKCSHQMCRKYH